MAKAKTRIKKHERPMGVAIVLGLLAAGGIGLVIGMSLYLMPNNPVHDFVAVTTDPHYAPTVIANSAIAINLWNSVALINLFVTAFCLFCSGLVLGKLAPVRAGYKRALRASAGMALGFLVVVIFGPWLVSGYGGYLETHKASAFIVSRSILLLNLASIVLYTGGSLLCTYLGLLWRDRGTPQSREVSSPATAPVSTH